MDHVRNHMRAVIAFVVMAGLAMSAASVAAQDATGTAVAQDMTQTATAQMMTQTPPAPAPPTPNHPVALHEGTCQQPTAEPAFDLGETAPFSNDQGTAIPQQEFRGKLTAPPLLISSGQPDVALDNLLDPAKPYVVVVHESEQAYETYLACGEVGGPVIDDRLVIGIRPLNNSGVAGTATFEGGDQTTGVVYLMTETLALSGQAAATPPPAETPTPAPTFPPAASPTAEPSPTPAATNTPVPTNTPAPTQPVVVQVTATPAP